jgi:hypothetical protein
MGAAAIGLALWRYEMRYNPANPDWFNRDRQYTRLSHTLSQTDISLQQDLFFLLATLVSCSTCISTFPDTKHGPWNRFSNTMPLL